MSEQHTPGPWALNPFAAQVDAFDREIGNPVCELLWPTPVRSEAETTANGYLIAAAPDMLQALRAARSYIVIHYNDFGEVMNDQAVADLALVETAIAKAGGRT